MRQLAIVIVVSVKEAIPRGRVKKRRRKKSGCGGDTEGSKKGLDGRLLGFDGNAAVLLSGTWVNPLEPEFLGSS